MTVGQLYVVAVVSGSAYVFFNAAETGALPNVVAPNQLTAAVSAQEISSSTTAVVAAPIGGVLFGTFRGFPFLVDAVSFALSACALSAVRAPFSAPKPTERSGETHLTAEVLGGVRWLFSHPVLGRVAVAAGLLQVAISGVGLVVILDVRDQGGSTALVGVVLSAVGIGGVLGALVANRVQQRLGFARTLRGVATLQAVFWVLLATSPSLWLTAATLVLFAGTMPIFGVAVLSYQMRETPDALRGRVGTAFGLLTWGATPVGAAGAGVLLAHFSIAETSLLFAAWTAVVAALCVLVIHAPGLHADR